MKIEQEDKTLIWIGAYAIASVISLVKGEVRNPQNIDTEASNFADRVSKTIEKKLKEGR